MVSDVFPTFSDPGCVGEDYCRVIDIDYNEFLGTDAWIMVLIHFLDGDLHPVTRIESMSFQRVDIEP